MFIFSKIQIKNVLKPHACHCVIAMDEERGTELNELQRLKRSEKKDYLREERLLAFAQCQKFVYSNHAFSGLPHNDCCGVSKHSLVIVTIF